MFTQYFWRRMHCLFYMENYKGWYTDTQREDTGYCLDRYSLLDSDREG